MAKGNVESVRSRSDLEAVIGKGKPVVVYFRNVPGQIDEVFTQLSADTPEATFVRFEAEDESILEEYGVSSVPYFVFHKEDGEVVDTLEGLNPAELAHKVAKLSDHLPK